LVISAAPRPLRSSTSFEPSVVPHGLAEGGPRATGAREDLVEPGQAGLGGIGVADEPLARVQAAGRRLHREVGERAADIEAHAMAGPGS
jgi:hypothetical protein